MPASRELRYALKKLNLRRLGDLNITTEKDLRSVLKNTSQIVAELEDLLERARTRVPAVPPPLPAPLGKAPLPPTNPQPPTAEKEPRLPPPSSAPFSRIPEENFLGEPISPQAWAALAITPVESAQLGVRAMNAAQVRHCNYLSDICQRTRGFWAQQRNVGRKTLDEFEHVIRDAISAVAITEPPASENTTADPRIEAAKV